MTTPEPSTADLVTRLTDEVGRLVRDELRLAQAEMTATARKGARGAALLGAAGVLGAMAAGTSAAFLVRLAERVLPPGAAALLATGALGGGAGVLAARGVQELRRLELVPQRALASVREDVAAATGPAGPGS